MTGEEIEKKAEDWYKNTVKINEWKKGVLTTYMPNATTGFIAGAKLMQKENNRLAQHIVELQKDKGTLTDENNRLLDVINGQDVKIADLEKKVGKLQKVNCEGLAELNHYNGELIIEVVKKDKQIEQAKEIIQKAVFQNICYNCDFGIDHCSQCRNGTLRKKAEQFLKEGTR